MWHILEEEICSQVSDNSQKKFKLKMIEQNTYCPMKQLDTFNFNKKGIANSILIFKYCVTIKNYATEKNSRQITTMDTY